MSETRVLVSWSGGKDSALTLEALWAAGATVTGLLTTITHGEQTVSSHGVAEALVRRQADALGLALRTVSLPPDASNEVYRRAIREALDHAATEGGIEQVAFGDVRLADVRAFREEQVTEAGLRARFPLWGASPDDVVARTRSAGVVATVVRVDRTLVDGALAGRRYDAALIADLPPEADPAGEHGEFHTFVHRGPGFAWSVDADVVGHVTDERFTTAVLATPDT